MLMLQAVSDTDDHRQVSGSQSPALVFPLPRHSSIRRIKEELYGELFDESIFFNASIHHRKVQDTNSASTRRAQDRKTGQCGGLRDMTIMT